MCAIRLIYTTSSTPSSLKTLGFHRTRAKTAGLAPRSMNTVYQ
jgi:hypothetical protein